MKLYYRAVSQDGKTLRGLIEARDIKDAAQYLRKHQLIPIKIIPASKTGMAQYFPFLHRASNNDLIFFTRQLASMLTAGLTLVQALQIMRNQSSSVPMEEILVNIITEIEGGKTFSESLEKHPKLFSPIYIALIRTAESSGLLDKVLLRLADNLEKEAKLKNQIRNAMIYPITIIVMMIVVVCVMMIYVIPQLSELYTSLNVNLPLPTLIVISISNFVKNSWEFVLLAIVAAVYFVQRWYHKEEGRRFIDNYLLRIPLFGKLLNMSMTVEFTRTFGLLIGSGSLVVESLLKTSDVVNNILYHDAIVLVAKRVEKGIAIGDAMESSQMFPSMVVEMVKLGQQTGKLDESLLRASEYYEREVEQTVKTITTLMEPIIMVFLAVGVGFLIISVITPVYNLMNAF